MQELKVFMLGCKALALSDDMSEGVKHASEDRRFYRRQLVDDESELSLVSFPWYTGCENNGARLAEFQ